MSKKMLINAVHPEQKRMAIVEDGKLVEFNIQMAVREPITGNIYKGIVMKVERGLQAAFVNYGGKKDGFLPLRDVSSNYFTEKNGSHDAAKHALKTGQEILVQVLREVSERKGALLTSYISLPGRYLVLLPNKESSGISRKIEDEEDRKRLKELVEQIKTEGDIGFIVRTAGMNRTKQELARDYQHLFRLWTEIKKKSAEAAAPAFIYQESAFGVRSLRDYFVPDIDEILVDDMETFRQMRTYWKTVAPRNLRMIKLAKEKTPLFDKFQLEDQINVIYQERVDLGSGGYVIINPTEAMITIDVNSGRGSHKRNVEETAYQTNLEAAEEIARQLRLRDLGGLIVIDFIDMMEQKHNTEVEKAFKKALTMDRSRIQLSHISKFGIMELSRQKKQSTIQEISYTPCPYCHGRGVRPSLEYTALNTYRKIETQAVKGVASEIKANVPQEVADYLQNQKRAEISRLEAAYDISIHIYGNPQMAWEECKIEITKREIPSLPETNQAPKSYGSPETESQAAPLSKEQQQNSAAGNASPTNTGREENYIPSSDSSLETSERQTPKKKSHRRPRHRRKTPADVSTPSSTTTSAAATAESTTAAPATAEAVATESGPADRHPETPASKHESYSDPLNKLKKIFEEFTDND